MGFLYFCLSSKISLTAVILSEVWYLFNGKVYEYSANNIRQIFFYDKNKFVGL